MITKALCTLKYKTGRLNKADVRRLHISCKYLSFKSIKCKNLKLGGGHLDQHPGGGCACSLDFLCTFKRSCWRDTRDVQYSIMNIDSRSFFVPSRHLLLVLFVLFLYRTSKV